MKQSIRGRLSFAIMAVVLFIILLFGVVCNLSIRKEFKLYVKRQQEKKTEGIIESIKHSYKAQYDEWDINELHAIGMSVLYEGFIITVYDRAGDMVWDAESHDMSLCNQIRNDISTRMKSEQAGNEGTFETSQYRMQTRAGNIGSVSVSFYGPYFYSQNDFSFLNALTKIVFIIGGIAVVLTIGIAYFLANNISRPILKAVDVANQIANGRYNVVKSKDTKVIELDQLSSSIHKMADSIMEQELLRKQLTSDVAHELRTPLTAVSTHLEAMLVGIWEPSTKHLESCYEEVNRIIYIVKDLEQLEKLERERYELKYASFSMNALVRKLLENFAIQIKEKGLVITLDMEEIIIVADEERISQVMMNLISNAVKYTHEGDKITIHMEESNEEVEVTVSDTGIGIDKEELPYVFERFYRADKSRNRKTGGAGIGLAIVKTIVEAHRGSIMVESEKGKGTSFIVRLPKHQMKI
ncbi:MAG: HAMP domain-containing sensor histidine kinase [bacterium]|nr:HAMP domain-containing sensor histidine kinase [bacterium]